MSTHAQHRRRGPRPEVWWGLMLLLLGTALGVLGKAVVDEVRESMIRVAPIIVCTVIEAGVPADCQEVPG